MEEIRKSAWVFGVAFLLIAIAATSGCVDQRSTSEKVRDTCIELCRSAQNNPQVNMSAGPCLSDASSWSMPNWVCDVAHSPREAVDDLPENQCSEFRNGDAQFFVEVSPDCEFINSNCCY